MAAADTVTAAAMRPTVGIDPHRAPCTREGRGAGVGVGQKI